MAEKLTMQRSVAQLLFHYLPGRMVDWEGGLAVTYLTSVHFSNVWQTEKASLVLTELSRVFDRWRARGGEVDRSYPDPRHEVSQYTVGTPDSIDAIVLQTGLVCPRCERLVFFNLSQQLGGTQAAGRLQCPSCSRRGMRQIGQVFVHGCGESETVDKFLPAMRTTDTGGIKLSSNPIACPTCRDEGKLFFQNRTDRLKDLKIECRNCNTVIRERLTASCPKCVRDIINGFPESVQDGLTSVPARVAMRMTRYSASAAYYPQTFSILRLDRPALNVHRDDEITLLERMSSSELVPAADGLAGTIAFLARRLAEAEGIGDVNEANRIQKQIANAVTTGRLPSDNQAVRDLVPRAADLQQALREAVAFRTTVESRDALHMAKNADGASSFLTEEIGAALKRMGINSLALVEDLPIVSATFGYTRRTFEPTFDELTAEDLPTRIRPFFPIDEYESRRHNDPAIIGTIPILAREGEHEGLFISLDPQRVESWLRKNQVLLTTSEKPIVAQMLGALEEIDPYYDQIWQRQVRRLFFGLIHTISHAAMRVASSFVGVERTSIAEYVFLPLLGAVIYDSSSSFKLGGFEAMVRDRLQEFVSALAEDAISCLYDPQCIDHKGACHGCIHSPDISCRVFNHGLSRSFLTGGHAPWADIGDETRIVGYWE